jgi:hypothetical protein
MVSADVLLPALCKKIGILVRSLLTQLQCIGTPGQSTNLPSMAWPHSGSADDPHVTPTQSQCLLMFAATGLMHNRMLHYLGLSLSTHGRATPSAFRAR